MTARPPPVASKIAKAINRVFIATSYCPKLSTTPPVSVTARKKAATANWARRDSATINLGPLRRQVNIPSDIGYRRSCACCRASSASGEVAWVSLVNNPHNSFSEGNGCNCIRTTRAKQRSMDSFYYRHCSPAHNNPFGKAALIPFLGRTKSNSENVFYIRKG
jgi:hypothetical protein